MIHNRKARPQNCTWNNPKFVAFCHDLLFWTISCCFLTILYYFKPFQLYIITHKIWDWLGCILYLVVIFSSFDVIFLPYMLHLGHSLHCEVDDSTSLQNKVSKFIRDTDANTSLIYISETHSRQHLCNLNFKFHAA